MRLFTVFETKVNSFGVFPRRILGLEEGGTVLLVSPCIKPQCPDLGFMKVHESELENTRFESIEPLENLDPRCVTALQTKFQENPLPETDDEFTAKWFTEIARVTDLKRHQQAFSRLLE